MVVAGVQVGLQRLGGKGMIGVVVPWLALEYLWLGNRIKVTQVTMLVTGKAL